MPDANLEYYNPKDFEAELDRMVTQAINAALRGENIEQLLDVMLTAVPSPARERLRKKFSAALKKNKLREPAGEADVPSRTVRARLMNLFTVSARQALDRIMALAKAKPDIATRIQQAGRILLRHGVAVDRAIISEAELGDMAPTATVKATRDQGTTRGA